jgi:iron complex outermembrane receptor protein
MIAQIMMKFARYKRLSRWFLGPISSWFYLHFILPGFLAAQTDSVSLQHIVLPEAIVQEPPTIRTGYMAWRADSLPFVSPISLANRMALENGLFLRQNAPGTLATVSARGAGPNRTAVIWNGLNLQSPMNGVVDASLIPLWPGDRLTVRQGGNSAAQGSGSMGGCVLVESVGSQQKNGLHGNLGANFGSFEALAFQSELTFHTSQCNGTLRANWQDAENDFTYLKKGLDGREYPTKQVNNFVEKTDIQQFNQWRIDKKNKVSSAAWWQNAFRQIPPASTESPSNTWQRDRATRLISNWEHKQNSHSTLQTRLAFQDEFIAFQLAGKTEESRSQNLLASTELETHIGHKTSCRFVTSAQWLRAQSDGYEPGDNWYQQRRLSGTAQFNQLFSKKVRLTALIRQEWAEKQAAPFTYTLGWEFPIRKLGKARGHFSRNYNLPTFNDRFWKALGNKDLLPEKGYSADLGWSYKTQPVALDVTAFYLLLDDWILWQPGSDGLFRPDNLRQVISKGIETAVTSTFMLWHTKFAINLHLQCSETYNSDVSQGLEAYLNKQLPYTPMLSGGLGIRAHKGAFSGAYLQQITGKRYVSSDNLSELPAFSTATLQCNFDFGQLKNWRLSNSFELYAAVENLWDTTYQSLANRPMPGRNWRVGLRAKW